jgi:hypothetical protein
MLLLCCRFVSFSTANGRMNSIIHDPRLRRRDEWDGGRGCCRVEVYVGMSVGGVEGELESGGSGSISVGGWKEGWMSGMECMEINCFLGDDVLMVLWILNPLIASICVHIFAHLISPSSLRGFAPLASSIRLLTFRASVWGKLICVAG